MHFLLFVFLFFITSNVNYARNCRRVYSDDADDEEATTTIAPTTIAPTTIAPTTSSYDSDEIQKLLDAKTSESAAILVSKVSKQVSESRTPFNDLSKIGIGKAYACSKIECPITDIIKPVCACNFNTGNVASFRNKCEAQKHNCRFDTNFKVILEEICPWEFSFRSGKKFEFDYRDAKYYN